GKKAVRFTEQGQGQLSPYPQPVRWTMEATWLAEKGFHPLDFVKTVTAMDGSPVVIERKHFDIEKGNVRLTREFPHGRTETKTLPTPPDTLAVEGIAGILRFLPFESSNAVPLHLLSNEPKLYPVKLVIRGKETVRTAPGSVESYKVDLVPELGFLNLFRSLAPKTFFWFTAAPPHSWVRFEGPENGPGTPEVIMEQAR